MTTKQLGDARNTVVVFVPEYIYDKDHHRGLALSRNLLEFSTASCVTYLLIQVREEYDSGQRCTRIGKNNIPAKVFKVFHDKYSTLW